MGLEERIESGSAKQAALERVAATGRGLAEARDLHAQAILEACRFASMREIARAGGDPLSRVYEISRHRGEPGETAPGVADALDDAMAVAGSAEGVYGFYRRHAAWHSQAYRSIRPSARYLAFYVAGAICPEVPAIVHTEPSVRLDDEAIAALASGGGAHDRELAEVAQALRDERLRQEGTSVQIVLLSPLDDPRTLTLERPIRHLDGSPWTRNLRYVSSQALRTSPDNTHDLQEAQMSVVTAAPTTSVIDPSIRLVALKINQTYYEGMPAEELYERTRYAWATNPLLHNPEHAFSVAFGICRAVYRIHRWEPVDGGRWMFYGELDQELTDRYVGLDVGPDVGRGSNPVRYLNC